MALEPFGFDVDDHRFGMHLATILAAQGAKGVSAEDFMLGPRLEEPPAEEQNERFVEALQRAFGVTKS